MIRHARKVINMETGRFLLCCWNDCERAGVTLHEAREYDGPDVIKYVFCSERHKMYWVHSSRDMGNLPPGYSLSIT